VDDKDFLAALVAFLSIGMAVSLLVLLELRAQWRQRDELNRLLIMSLFRMSKAQIRSTEEQTRRIEAALGGRCLDPALLAEAGRERSASSHDVEAVAEDEAFEEESEPQARRRVQPGANRSRI
jgi:hypothetical protein